MSEQAKKCAQLLAAVDADHNGSISYDEFERLFLKAAARIGAFRKKLNAAKKGQAAAAPPAAPLSKEEREHKKHLTHMLRSARKKFDKFDTDHNGAIEGAELEGIVQWLWASFHVNGEQLSASSQAEKSAQLLAAVDTDHNGSINYEEFEKLFLKAAERIAAFHKRLNAAKKKASPSPPARRSADGDENVLQSLCGLVQQNKEAFGPGLGKFRSLCTAIDKSSTEFCAGLKSTQVAHVLNMLGLDLSGQQVKAIGAGLSERYGEFVNVGDLVTDLNARLRLLELRGSGGTSSSLASRVPVADVPTGDVGRDLLKMHIRFDMGLTKEVNPGV